MLTRRTFLCHGAVGVATFVAGARQARANPLGLPAGLQLYSVRDQMAQNLDGTLAAVRKAGYTEVEAATLPKKSAKDLRAAMDAAGLKCVSSHRSFADLTERFQETADFDKQLGCAYIICPGPGRRGGPAANTRQPLSLDDWKYNADQFNEIGDRASRSGLTFGYHNHTVEFIAVDGKTPYLELLRWTDPAKVTFEMDAGWVAVAGVDAVKLMREHPHRFTLLHIKDFKLASHPQPDKREESTVTELGRGSIDYRPLFAQAKRNQNVKHAFVEQEAFDMPWQQSLQLDAAYWRQLVV